MGNNKKVKSIMVCRACRSIYEDPKCPNCGNVAIAWIKHDSIDRCEQNQDTEKEKSLKDSLKEVKAAVTKFGEAIAKEMETSPDMHHMQGLELAIEGMDAHILRAELVLDDKKTTEESHG